MSWWRSGPRDYWRQVPPTVNRWWDSIRNTMPAYSHGQIRFLTLGSVTFILSPSSELMRSESRARHNTEMPTEAAGMTWSDGTNYEIYALYKRTAAGHELTNPLAIGNEVGHIFQLMLKMADPDKVDTKEFYGQ